MLETLSAFNRNQLRNNLIRGFTPPFAVIQMQPSRKMAHHPLMAAVNDQAAASQETLLPSEKVRRNPNKFWYMEIEPEESLGTLL